MAELLNDDEIATRLRRLPWEREGDEIVREWRFEDFAEAIAFVNRVAEAAEEANHHPDIFIHGWNKVKLSLDQPLRRRPDRDGLRDGGPVRRAELSRRDSRAEDSAGRCCYRSPGR